MNTTRLDHVRRLLPLRANDEDGREWFSTLGGIGVLVFGCIAVFGPVIAPFPADAAVGQPFEAPSDAHLLGTDDAGHDILSMLLVGARASMLVGLAAGSLAISLGIVVGVAAGVLGGRTETALMRLVDVVLTLPFLPLVIVVAAVYGPALETTIGVLALVMWARPARELRSEVLSIRQREYIDASRAMGASALDIASRYVVPAVLLIAIAQFARVVSMAILLEASLSFLGLGDPTTTSWGTILFYAQQRSAFLTDAWAWWVLPPGLAITLSVLSFIFLTLGIERRMGADRRSIATDVPSATFTLATEDTEHALTVEGLTVAYGAYPPTVAVDDVDIEVADDEILGVVGESGSGKSSLALALLDLLRAPGRVTAGHITLATDRNHADATLADVRGDDIAFVPQEAMNALDPRQRLTTQLVEAIETHRAVDRETAEQRAHAMLERVGLPTASHSRYPHELSGGMCQRGVIAMALVNDPGVLVVDEPTTGLDMVTKVALLELLESLQADRELSVVVISHDLPAVTRIADRIAVMQDGRVVETGETARLEASPSHPYTERLLAARTPLAARETAGRSASADPRDGEPQLVYEGVAKSFGGERVLDGVDFQVERGQSVALLGESGAGKSTMGRLALGLLAPDAGTVRIDGRDVHEWRRQDARGLGREVHYVFQDPYCSLPPNRRVNQIVREPLTIHDEGTSDDRTVRVRQALRDVDLDPDEYAGRYAAELSGGERQRVAFARALVLDPAVLIADEPTSMLDAPLQHDLLTLLYDLVADRSITLLHITHDIAQASAFADEIAVLHEGHIVEQAAIAPILDCPAHDQTRTLVEAARALSAPSHAAPER